MASNMTAPNFAAFKSAQALLDAELSAATEAIKAIPGHASGPMGLTPDRVKALPAWRAARARVDCAFAALRAFNEVNVKRYAREIRAERDAKRERALSGE
jgi:hypothetical protein